jgi:hypothetical protein
MASDEGIVEAGTVVSPPARLGQHTMDPPGGGVVEMGAYGPGKPGVFELQSHVSVTDRATHKAGIAELAHQSPRRMGHLEAVDGPLQHIDRNRLLGDVW